MFMEISGTVKSCDKWGKYSLEVSEIIKAQVNPITENGIMKIKFSKKHQDLADITNADLNNAYKRIYHISTYDWNFNGKNGTTYFCYKIE